MAKTTKAPKTDKTAKAPKATRRKVKSSPARTEEQVQNWSQSDAGKQWIDAGTEENKGGPMEETVIIDVPPAVEEKAPVEAEETVIEIIDDTAPTATFDLPIKTAPVEPAPVEAKAKEGPKEKTGFKWTDKRLAIVRAMKAMGATSGGEARTATDIAEAAGVTGQDVKHYCYKDNDLVKEGYVSAGKREGSPLLVYSLTAKGAEAIETAAK